MFQFLKYLLHKQIIEMCHSQNLRRPVLVPCPTQWYNQDLWRISAHVGYHQFMRKRKHLIVKFVTTVVIEKIL